MPHLFMDIPVQAFPSFLEEIEEQNKSLLKFYSGILCDIIEEYHEELVIGGKVYPTFIKNISVLFRASIRNQGWKVSKELSKRKGSPKITKFDDYIPRYRFDGAFCEICENRKCRDSFYIVVDDSYTKKVQVGLECLGEFLGISNFPIEEKAIALSDTIEFFKYLEKKYGDPSQVLLDMGILEQDRDQGFGRHNGPEEDHDSHPYDISTFLTLVEDIIREEGYVSKSKARNEEDSTAFKARARYLAGDNPSPSSFVQEAVEWVTGNPLIDMSLAKKLRTLVKRQLIRKPQTDLASYIIPLYQKHLRDKARRAISNWVGREGQRMEIDVTLEEIGTYSRNTTIRSEPGMSNVYTFKDKNQNVLLWFTTSEVFQGREGDSFRIRATVREHDEYLGEKRTILNRVFEVR